MQGITCDTISGDVGAHQLCGAGADWRVAAVLFQHAGEEPVLRFRARLSILVLSTRPVLWRLIPNDELILCKAQQIERQRLLLRRWFGTAEQVDREIAGLVLCEVFIWGSGFTSSN